MRLAPHHRVYPLVYLQLKGMDASLIPPEIMASLQRHYHNNVMKIAFKQEMSQLCEALKDNGVRTLLLKGPILATHSTGIWHTGLRRIWISWWMRMTWRELNGCWGDLGTSCRMNVYWKIGRKQAITCPMSIKPFDTDRSSLAIKSSL